MSFAYTQARAVTRAWLDRSEVMVDQPVVLNIETDQGGPVTPDYTPLRSDFEISDPFRNQRYENINGRSRSSTVFGMVLRPVREGHVSVPSLKVGGESTEILSLTVLPAAQASSTGPADQVVLETEVDDDNPYVQQTVSVVVRLSFAVGIASGQLELPVPDGAILRQIGDDVQSSRTINGRRYLSIERHYLLIPESSGALTLPAPRFEGQSQDLYNRWDFFSSNDLQARGRPMTLQVRALPAQAPQPWLPLHDLELRYAHSPVGRMVAGESMTLGVEMTARGAAREQFSEWPLLTVSGAEVFPEPVEYSDSFVDGSQQLRMIRKYSVVPNAAGTLAIPGMQMAWWDTGRGEARISRLPDLNVQVTPGTGLATLPVVPASVTASSPAQGAVVPLAATASAASGPLWKILSIVMACLWLLTMLAWWWQSRRKNGNAVDAGGWAGSTGAQVRTRADLKRALDAGELGGVGDVLRQMHDPVLPDLDALMAELADPEQRASIERLRRARWGDGDVPAARNALREAFRKGPEWVPEGDESTTDIPSLPPLYPRR
ncbi:MAG: BatD family protein [Xanthomonadaceae bacterium]|nr:BatD family protein [Xanthomonadaceae bacterium]